MSNSAFELPPQMLVARGMPEGLAYRANGYDWEELVSRIEIDSDKKVPKSISVKSQMNFFQNTFKKPFDKNYIFCVSGETSETMPMFIAKLLFSSALVKAQDNPHKPYWHVVYGGFADVLRDSDADTLSIKTGARPSLMVISNIAVNSTPSKIEKLRDVLAKYSNIPRIVVVAGDNPISFCAKYLFMSPNKVMYFGFKTIG